ncbi:MAG TPA: VOC family protein [Hanamia sp.]|jgi:PhnB protein|nr:VOC family protein [Hanamia sp.]
MNIPENYQTVMPYLILPNAARFISFTEKVFGAKEKLKYMRDVATIMHAEIMIEGSTIMLADATEEFKTSTAGLFIYVENADETFAKAMNEGATVVREIADQDYGRSGGIKDPFGNVWWITTPK